MSLISLLMLLCATLNAQTDPVSWVNGVRQKAGSPRVAADELLSRTAALWAESLAAAGILSHKGDDGSTALDRYRALGGTEVRVGEILGAGPDLPAIEKGWMASSDHRRLALLREWTHAGWGIACSGTSRVTVMLFTEKLADQLLIVRNGDGMTLSGRFIPSAASRAILYNGLDQVMPTGWDPDGRAFRFELTDKVLAGYLRLGYVNGAGRFILTNAFTWPPGTESPGGQGRFAPPAPSP